MSEKIEVTINGRELPLKYGDAEKWIFGKLKEAGIPLSGKTFASIQSGELLKLESAFHVSQEKWLWIPDDEAGS